jgi:nucleotide-binding universal stress UspA family protein
MFKKILVPLDGSELAAKILPQVGDLAKLAQGQVILMSVGSTKIGPADEVASGSLAAAEAQIKVPVLKYLEETAAALQAQGLEVTWVYERGSPAREIIAYAQQHQVDLIALASHGTGEVAWVLGSVAEKVISHATVPVLLWRVLEAPPPLHKSELAYFSM